MLELSIQAEVLVLPWSSTQSELSQVSCVQTQVSLYTNVLKINQLHLMTRHMPVFCCCSLL